MKAVFELTAPNVSDPAGVHGAVSIELLPFGSKIDGKLSSGLSSELVHRVHAANTKNLSGMKRIIQRRESGPYETWLDTNWSDLEMAKRHYPANRIREVFVSE